MLPEGRTISRPSSPLRKLKGFVRKRAPRSFDAVSNALAEALTTVSPTECANYVANTQDTPPPKCGGLEMRMVL